MTVLEADPFANVGEARKAGHFGMWVFLASEVMFFGVVIGAYLLTRLEHPQAFIDASRLTDVRLGSLNTIVLLTSSFTVAVAAQAAQSGQRRLGHWLLIATMLLGITFLVVKGIEYRHDFKDHLWPGGAFRSVGTDPHGVELFFWLYFTLTGLHALHLVIGIFLVGTLVKLLMKEPTGEAGHHLELSALYWHLVDVVWIFLFPMLYLVSRVPT